MDFRRSTAEKNNRKPKIENKKLKIAAAVRLVRRAVPDLSLLYLFGSQIADQAHAESDVDLALRADTALDPTRRWTVQEKLARRLGQDVDLVDLQTASTVMQMQVVSTGRVLYERDRAERDRFEVRVYSAYALLGEERRSILESIQQRGRIYDR